MTAFPSDLNTQSLAIQPYILVDQVSPTEIYIGTSLSFNSQSAEIWRINKIIQDGSVWVLTLYPDGDQGFKFKWSDRLTYTYQ
jgi:hypothetical protein